MKLLRILPLLAWLVALVHAQESPLTPTSLRHLLRTQPKGADAEKLAERVRNYFGKAAILQGPGAKVEELTVAWAIEVADAKSVPRVFAADRDWSLALERIGATNIYAAATVLPEGFAMNWVYEVDGKKLGPPNANRLPRPFPSVGVVPFQLEVYETHPDNLERPGVPKGKVTPMPKWQSKVFDGTTRDWWIYVPAQYTTDQPACVLVAQDGAGYHQQFARTLDNLIARGDVPVMVGIFISPGTFADGRSNRSVEYDTLSDKYARFVLDEILPEVAKSYKLRTDAASRMITGISSGGICAFTVAWEQPTEFHKVLSWVGSFTNIQQGADFKQGGHNYEALVRKAPKRNLRVYLQDGERDLDNANGNWPLANLTLAKSLEFAGYDAKFVYGQGFHSNRHGLALLPEAMRWLWRDYKVQ